jgi:hypothetical protein
MTSLKLSPVSLARRDRLGIAYSTVNKGTSDRSPCCGHKVRICEELEEPMFFQTVSPLFAAGEILLGLSLTLLVGALITTVSENARSRRR